MSKAILIIGESGSGKTTSLRNLPPDDPMRHSILMQTERGLVGKVGATSTTNKRRTISRPMTLIWFTTL